MTSRADESVACTLLHVQAVIVRDGSVLLDREVQEFGDHGYGSGVTADSLRAFLGTSPTR